MKNQEKIYLDREGYEGFLHEIEELKNQLNNNGKMKSEAYQSAVGDGWHDNFEFEDAKREEFRIMGLLKEKLENLSRIEIIDSKNINNDLIEINDFVTVKMTFNEDEPEDLLFKLVASNRPNLNSDTNEISINSPLGQTVYKKKIGDQGSYNVGDNKIFIIITNVLKDCDKQQQDAKTLRKEK